MRILPRHLREYADDLPGNRPRWTTAEQEREDRIVATATSLMVRFGRTGLTLGAFAAALRMSPHTIRKHFADLDSLLAHILIAHLQAVCTALGQSPYDAANAKAGRRAAYLRVTRTAFNAHTQAHILLTRERHTLPPDLAEPIEQLRLQVGEMLAGPHAETALNLLDDTSLQPAQIEAMLAALAPAPAKPQPKPAARLPTPPETAPIPFTPPPTPPRHARAGPH